MSRWVRVVSSLSFPVFVGCAAIPPPDILAELDEVRSSPSVEQAEKSAPDAVAEAEKLAREAKAAAERDDLAAAQILGEEAKAAYAEAIAAARAVEADRRQLEVTSAVEEAEQRLAGLEVEHQRVEADLRAVEARLEVLDNLEEPAASGNASGARADARRQAARAMLIDATVTCGAATLLAGSVEVDAVVKARARAEELRGEVDDLTKPPPIDAAMRARAACLDALTEVRRKTAADDAGADALLEDLAGAKLGRVQRDARGVVLVLRDLFDGSALSTAGKGKVERLIAIAKKGKAPVLVVAHEARGDTTTTPHRGDALVAALRAGLGAGRVGDPQRAGTHRPLVDPKGAYADDNRRMEIVFVTPRGL